MAYEVKPLFNNVLKANANVPLTVTFQRVGPVKQGEFGPSWPADVLFNAVEHTYWINGDEHYGEIQHFINAGHSTIIITMVPDYVNGKTKLRYMVSLPSGGATAPVQAQTVQAAPQTPSAPRPVAPAPSGGRNFEEEARGKVRFGVTIEILKGLIAEKKPIAITPQIDHVIDGIVEYVMSRRIVGATPDPVEERESTGLETIPF